MAPRPLANCVTEKIPELPNIDPSEIAGPKEGCPAEWELCVRLKTAREIEKYHNALRRAAIINASQCQGAVKPIAVPATPK